MEKQLEDLNINDSFESDQELPQPRLNRTFSFPPGRVHFSNAFEKSKLDKHYSEQTLPNINTSSLTTLSEMQSRIEKTKHLFHENSKDSKHFWHPRIDNVPSISAFVNDQVEYMEVEKYPDLTKYIHDTTASTSAPIQTVDQAEAMEIEKYVDSTNSAEYTNESKSMSKQPLPFAVIKQAQTNVLMSAVNLESQLSRRDENIAKLILTRRKAGKISSLKKTQEDNPDYTNGNDENDKKQRNYQKEDTRSKSTSKCSKFRTYFSICFVGILLTIVFLSLIPSREDQNYKHSNTFATAVVELNKLIFGQNRAIEALTEYLQQDSPLLKVIAIVGGTGVGKSYTVEIIRKNFHERNKSNRFFSSRAELLVLENLREEQSLDKFVNFVKTQQKSYGDRYTTILAVFNFEQMNDDLTRSIDLNKSIITIKNTFINANLDIKIIPYEPLSEEALEKCIINTAKNIRLTLSQEQIALIKRQLLENNTGCKGAYGKVQVIGRQ
ncbi:uncharacterized protein [Anoplolepis gracilipes]|uniref:uncharacterized protein isoform X1 n=1 Tax=Anoplolepis gracilipes TaxID=354296 RepID=UPI003B9F5877